MKITNVEAWVVTPDLGGLKHYQGEWQWTFVTIETDEGITGWGESSSSPRNGSLLTGEGLRAVREALIGEDPADIDSAVNSAIDSGKPAVIDMVIDGSL